MLDFIVICTFVFIANGISHYTNWFHFSGTSYIIGFTLGCLVMTINNVIDYYNCLQFYNYLLVTYCKISEYSEDFL